MFFHTKNGRMAAIFAAITVTGMVVSALAWTDLAHSEYPSMGYLTFDEMLSALWLFGFGLYLTVLVAFGLSALVVFTVIRPIYRWVDHG